MPLSRTRRRLYFGGLLLIFLIAVPILFLYATGYRFGGFNTLVKTGGMYIGAERAGAQIYIDDTLIRETGTFRRAFFVQDLEPGTYTVRITKEGYHPWGKTLTVYPHIVTEAQAFNMPLSPLLTLIPPSIATPSSSTSTAPTMPNPVYERIYQAFATTSATSTIDVVPPRRTLQVEGRSALSADEELAVATTTKEFGGMRLYETKDLVIARWVRGESEIPYYFCIPDRPCASEIPLNTKGAKSSYFDFFPGSRDLVVVTLPDGVYVTELDNRSGQNIQPIFIAEGADFRIVDGQIYVALEKRLYELEL